MAASNALSAAPSPVRDVDIPKPPLKSSKPAVGKAKEGDLPESAREAAEAKSQGAREDLYVRVTSRDGDVLELRQPPQGEDGRDEVRTWVEQVKKELAEQQVQLLKRLLDGKQEEDGNLKLRGDGTLLFIEVGGPVADDGAPANVPEYWNAENTSDRIATFAIAMAAASVEQGGDAQAKIEEIVQAVTAGFEQAHAATGDLRGAAGRLYEETKNLVFEKLKKWLAQAESGSYNQTAENQSDPLEKIEAWN